MARLGRSFPAQALRFPTPRGKFVCDAASFDGATYAAVGGVLTVSDSKLGTFSVWVKSSTAGDYTLLGRTTPNRVRWASDGTFTIKFSGGTGSITLITPTPVPFDGAWHNIQASWDAAGSAWLHTDGASNCTISEQTNEDYLYSGVPNWGVGGSAGGAELLVGCMAELAFWPGSYLADTPANHERIRLSGTGQPADMGVDGAVVTGVAAACYFHLADGETAANYFTNRGTGGAFTLQAGGLTTCATSPTDSSNAFTQALASALSFAGVAAKRTGRALSGSLSFTAALAKSTARAISGSLSFAGGLAKSAVKVVAGAVSFSGGVTKQTGKTLPSAVSFSGSVQNAMARAVSASLSFAGATAKSTARALGGAVSFTAALSNQVGKALAGALSFAGTVTKQTGKILAATLSFVGVVSKAVARGFSAAVSFVGSLLTSLNGGATAYVQALAASLGFSGGLVKSTARPLSAAVSFVGSTTRAVSRALVAAVSFIGSLSAGHLFTQVMTAALSFAGAVTKQTGKALTATLSFTGVISRAISRAFAAALSFIGVRTDDSTPAAPPSDPANNIYVLLASTDIVVPPQLSTDITAPPENTNVTTLPSNDPIIGGTL